MDDWFKARLSWSDVMDCMTDTEAGQFAKAVWQYARTGELPEIDVSIRFAVIMATNILKDDQKKREEYCAIKRENGMKGGRPKKSESKQKPNNLMVSEETEQNLKNLIRNKKEEKEIREEKKETRYKIEEQPAFSVSDEEITASLNRDSQIEDACRDYGLPCYAGQMVKARDLADEYSVDWLVRAIQTAGASKETARWQYVEGVLRNWRKRGSPDAKPTARSGMKAVNAQCYEQRKYTDAEIAAQRERMIADMFSDD